MGGLAHHVLRGGLLGAIGALAAVMGAALGVALALVLGAAITPWVGPLDPDELTLLLTTLARLAVPACTVLAGAIALHDLGRTNGLEHPPQRGRFALRWAIVMPVTALAAFLAVDDSPVVLDHLLAARAPWVAAAAGFALAGVGASADLAWLAGRAAPPAPAPTSQAGPRDVPSAQASDPG